MGRPSEKIDREGKPLKVVGCTCVVLRIMIKISRAKDIIKCKKWVNKNLALVRIHEWTWIVISSQHVPFKDLWLVGMISIKSDPSVINSSSQHQDKGTLSAQLVSSSLSWMDFLELYLCYSRKTSDKGLRSGLSSLSLLDMDKSPSSVSTLPTVLPPYLLVRVWYVHTFLSHCHLPSSFCPESDVSIQPWLLTDAQTTTTDGAREGGRWGCSVQFLVHCVLFTVEMF